SVPRTTPPPRSRRLRTWLASWAPAVPLLALVAFCLAGPAVVLVAQSFVTPEGFSLRIWQQVLSQPVSQSAIVTSIELGVASATFSLLIGAPVAWIISRMFSGRRALWLGLLNVGANFGGIGIAFAYLATLGSVGMVTLALQAIGIAFDPPRSSSF